MNKLLEARNEETTVTTNRMATFASSLDHNVDLFFKIGASRGKDIIPDFSKAFAEDQALATRIALWARDVRGGAGERKLFRDILTYLANFNVDFAKRVAVKVPELGRWDDLYSFFGTPVERDALRLIVKALDDGNGLCAKWMDRKGANANKVRAYLQKTPKQYRKMLVELTKVVETQMCANQWESIEFGKLPSLASARYQKAFTKHVPELYGEYKAKLATGEEKVNAGAVYPYDITKSVKMGDEVVSNAQWKALPDYLAGNDENILPVVDVSGSMSCSAGGNPNVQCVDVAVSLGLYVCERTRGQFKDTFITFSEDPTLQVVKGDLSDRVKQMYNAKWGYNTNFERVFSLVLNTAVKHSVPKEDMPTTLLVFSDMQFDAALRGGSNPRAFEMVRKMYSDAGYTMPKIVFWNLNASSGVPVTFDQQGTALVSGFSPALMTSILSGKNLTPQSLMLDVIMKDRYDF